MISIQLKKTTKGVAQRHCTERKKWREKTKQDRNQKNKDKTTVLDVKSY